MSENPISITTLNDFIFCPVSIYFHQLESDTEKKIYQSSYQLNGSAAHEKPDSASYSDKKSVWQGRSVYCEKYDLMGKIDVFFSDEGRLVERKKKIKTIYDGYVFQLYAQYFALKEMGEDVRELFLYSMDDNKRYKVLRPEENSEMFFKFEKTIRDIKEFTLTSFIQENTEKCSMCIYNELCSFACTRKVKI